MNCYFILDSFGEFVAKCRFDSLREAQSYAKDYYSPIHPNLKVILVTEEKYLTK